MKNFASIAHSPCFLRSGTRPGRCPLSYLRRSPTSARQCWRMTGASMVRTVVLALYWATGGAILHRAASPT